MGEIPLLTRHQEIALAKRIEITRAQFRRKLLECDFVIQYALRILNRVHKGELPFDRTVQVSVTDRLEKDQILGRADRDIAERFRAVIHGEARGRFRGVAGQRESQNQNDLRPARVPHDHSARTE